MDHSSGRGLTDPGRGRLGIIAVKERNPGDHQGENQALDGALHDVFMPVDGGLHGRPEAPFVHAEPVHADQLAAEDADQAEHKGQQRHADDASPEAGGHHPAQRVDRHHLEA